MTNDNFYKNQRRNLPIVFSAALQYAGLISGVAAGVASVTSPDSKALPFMLFGAVLYVLGKGVEYEHRSEALSASFTHLEETLREEFKKNSQSPP